MASDYERIEAYLAGELPDAARAELEARLQREPALAESLDRHRAAHQLLGYSSTRQLKKKLQQWENGAEDSARPGKVSPLYRYRWVLAAGLALLLLAAAWGWVKSQYSDAALLAHYGTAYPALALRGESTTDDPFVLGAQAYNQAQYTLAAEALAQVPSRDPRFVEAQFYLGQAYFQQQQYADALAAWQEVSRAEDPRFGQATEWYTLLAEIGAGLDEAAQFRLQRLQEDPDHPYAELARKLAADRAHFLR